MQTSFCALTRRPAAREARSRTALALVIALLRHPDALARTGRRPAAVPRTARHRVLHRERVLPPTATAAVDGNPGTRWSSAVADPQWLQVDLGPVQQINRVTLTWEAAYARAYQIQTSTDAANWTTVHSTTTATGGTQNLTVTGSGCCVRINGMARATQYGYSLWEFQVYGPCGGTTPPDDF